MSREVGKKKMDINWNTVNSRFPEMVAQLVQKSCDTLTKFLSFGTFQDVIEPYMWFNRAVIQFRLLLDSIAKDRSSELGDAIQFLCYSILERVSDLLSNSSLYKVRDERSQLKTSQFRWGHLPLVLATLPDSIIKALNIVWPWSLQLGPTETDEDGKVVIRSDSKSAIIFYNRTR